MSNYEQLLILAQQDIENARILLDNSSYRASISRAYYAIYYGVQALLDARQIASRTHRGMLKQFGQHFVQSGEFSKETARALKEIYDLRQLSDYEADAVIDKSSADRALTVSDEFVKKVCRFLQA